MKLQNNRRKRTLIVFAVLVGLVVIAGIGAIIITANVNAEKQEVEDRNIIRGISVTAVPVRMVYYVGESFDPTGAKIQVLTNSVNYTYFVDWTELTFEGFDSSEVSDSVEITVSYMGFTTSFPVKIIEPIKPAPTLVDIELYNFQTTYPLDEWNTYGPNSTGAKIKCIYDDGSIVENIVLRDKYIYGVTDLDKAGKTEITIKYSDGVTVIEKTVTITVTN